MSKRTSTLRETCNSVIFLAISIAFIIWLSIFSYGTFYYFYIPPVAHMRPAFLQFDTSCQSGICSFPTANISLVHRGQDQLLTRGQPYRILLDLEMPESAANRRLGMFMVKLSFFSQDGLLLKSSFRSGLLHYKSNLLRYLNTLIFSPLLLAGSWEEKQMVTISLFENYNESPDFPAYHASIELHSRTIEIYSATLRIHAHFSGLRYYMYYWPLLSALVGICTNFYFLALVALLSWYRFLQWQGLQDTSNESLAIQSPKPLQTISEEDEPPFTPVPLNLDAATDISSGNKEDTGSESRQEEEEDGKSQGNLSLQSHSSVQDLAVVQRSRSEEATNMNVPDSIEDDDPLNVEKNRALRKRKSESF